MADKMPKWVKDIARTTEGQMLLERERVFVDATECLSEAMLGKGVNNSELARRLGVSRPWVTQMLSGSNNLTLATLADAFFALGCSLQIGYTTSGSGSEPRAAPVRTSLPIGAPGWKQDDHLCAASAQGWHPEPPPALPASDTTPHGQVAA